MKKRAETTWLIDKSEREIDMFKKRENKEIAFFEPRFIHWSIDIWDNSILIRVFLSIEEPKQKANSLLDSLPGNSIISKTGYVTAFTGLSAFLVSKEIYVLNEETLVLVASTALLGVLLKYLREPFNNMANEHIDVRN